MVNFETMVTEAREAFVRRVEGIVYEELRHADPVFPEAEEVVDLLIAELPSIDSIVDQLDPEHDDKESAEYVWAQDAVDSMPLTGHELTELYSGIVPSAEARRFYLENADYCDEQLSMIEGLEELAARCESVKDMITEAGHTGAYCAWSVYVGSIARDIFSLSNNG